MLKGQASKEYLSNKPLLLNLTLKRADIFVNKSSLHTLSARSYAIFSRMTQKRILMYSIPIMQKLITLLTYYVITPDSDIQPADRLSAGAEDIRLRTDRTEYIRWPCLYPE